MEKERSSKIIAIVALVVAVIALSIGFASYSNSVNISSSATVTPTNDFSVLFSSSASSLLTNDVEAFNVSDGATATDAVIDNGTTIPTIGNLSATFTDPGQSVTYRFYVH